MPAMGAAQPRIWVAQAADGGIGLGSPSSRWDPVFVVGIERDGVVERMGIEAGDGMVCDLSDNPGWLLDEDGHLFPDFGDEVVESAGTAPWRENPEHWKAWAPGVFRRGWMESGVARRPLPQDGERPRGARDRRETLLVQLIGDAASQGRLRLVDHVEGGISRSLQVTLDRMLHAEILANGHPQHLWAIARGGEADLSGRAREWAGSQDYAEWRPGLVQALWYERELARTGELCALGGDEIGLVHPDGALTIVEHGQEVAQALEGMAERSGEDPTMVVREWLAAAFARQYEVQVTLSPTEAEPVLASRTAPLGLAGQERDAVEEPRRAELACGVATELGGGR